MGKENIQRNVKENNGHTISSSSFDIRDLLSATYDLLNYNGLREDLQESILDKYVIDKEANKENLSLVTLSYYNLVHIHEQKRDEAHILWNEDIYNYFNEIAPTGYYFGSHLGNSSSIGWYRVEG